MTGHPFTLVLDHIKGTNEDHRTENRRLLCSKCHGQQATFTHLN